MTNTQTIGTENFVPEELHQRIGAVSTEWSERITSLAKRVMGSQDVIDLKIEHHLHAGVYSRTVFQPAGVLCFAVMMHRPTQLVVSGKCVLYSEGSSVEVNGYKVLEGEAGRQVVVYTIEDTWGTMCFGTSAKTVEEAEKEFAGDHFHLLSNHHGE